MLDHTPSPQPSRFIAFFDECGDHSLAKIDTDFPVFVLALVVIERKTYAGENVSGWKVFP
jgi:hypothetical protein